MGWSGVGLLENFYGGIEGWGAPPIKTRSERGFVESGFFLGFGGCLFGEKIYIGAGQSEFGVCVTVL